MNRWKKEDNKKSALIHVYNYTNCTFVNIVDQLEKNCAATEATLSREQYDDDECRSVA